MRDKTSPTDKSVANVIYIANNHDNSPSVDVKPLPIYRPVKVSNSSTQAYQGEQRKQGKMVAKLVFALLVSDKFISV